MGFSTDMNYYHLTKLAKLQAVRNQIRTGFRT